MWLQSHASSSSKKEEEKERKIKSRKIN